MSRSTKLTIRSRCWYAFEKTSSMASTRQRRRRASRGEGGRAPGLEAQPRGERGSCLASHGLLRLDGEALQHDHGGDKEEVEIEVRHAQKGPGDEEWVKGKLGH